MLAALKSMREDNGFSQAQLATRLRKPASFVGKYELGERRLDAVELLVILNVLGAERETFLDKIASKLPSTLR